MVEFERINNGILDSFRLEIQEKKRNAKVEIYKYKNYNSEFKFDETFPGDTVHVTLSNNFELFIQKFLKLLNYSTKDDDWIIVDESGVDKKITTILWKDLAYNSEMMGLDIAKSLSKKFLKLLSKSNIAITNMGYTFMEREKFTKNDRTPPFFNSINHVLLPDEKIPKIKDPVKMGGGGFTISESTFDSGVIIIDQKKKIVGIFWIEDED